MRLYELYVKYEEKFKYLIIGFFTTFLSLVTYFLLTYFILDVSNDFELQSANVISWSIGVIFAYYTNKKIVFKYKSKNKLLDFGKFVGSRISTLILDIVIMFVFVSLLQFDDVIIKFISQLVVIVINYILSKYIVFI